MVRVPDIQDSQACPLCEVVTLLASITIPWVLAYVPWVHPRVGMGTARMKTFLAMGTGYYYSLL